ncbi:polysaccharide deacetylase [Reyranella sp.]|uniref:polysaccharide deacetylase family protein n=1 Tax=Reyranella sp. TaxID=1929291 RepID=UPI00121F2084|nr:polysaccharide deacetylase [Reyranella sp.]TAJ89869.1 MAG: polysaccharide deacetylase [Reyranella sp.]
MPRHIVCLTFDHDHVSGLIARGMTSPTAISRGEYDIVVIPRLVALMNRYGIKATFFTPGHTIDSTPAAVTPYVEAGHELAHHGWTHRLPVTLSRDEEEEEIVRGNESIKRISGRPARGYRSPAWDLSPHSIDLLLKHGIQYDSSLMGNDYDCYFARQGDVAELMKPLVRGRETALIEMPISWSLDDYPVFEYMRLPNGSVQQGLMNATSVLENFVDDFTYMTRVCDYGILTYTFHPHVIGRGHRMMMLERLIQRLIEGGAVFMTMEEAMQDWLARRQGVAKAAE